MRPPNAIDPPISRIAPTAKRALSLRELGSALAVVHRNLIVALAARHKLPAVYYERFYVAAGGLISYGPENAEDFVRRDCKAWQESMEQNAKATRRDIEDTRRGAGATENNS